MERQRNEQTTIGMATSPYVIRFARRRDGGIGVRQGSRRDRSHYPGRRVGDPRSPWRGVAILGIVLALVLAAWALLRYGV